MGKPLITQRRGKGSPSFVAPSHRFKADTRYRDYRKDGMIRAQVMELVDDPARSSLLALLKYEDSAEVLLPVAEGIAVGDSIEEGPEAAVGIGSILPVGQIPEGYPVFNIELRSGDGGSAVRSSGTCAFIVSKDADRVLIKLPSGAMKHFDARCRATVGCLAGGGRLEKPLLKAGKGHYKNIARGHWYPMVRGNKMNAGEHPFGGKQHHGAITPRGVGGSPGQHVGSFGSRRTGRKKR